MSNLWFNIRFGAKHLQIGPEGITFRVNPYWEKVSNSEQWFKIYCWFGIQYG